MHDQYLKEFEFVRKTFFPRWDRNGEWCFELADDCDGADGSCRAETKTITVVPVTSERLRVLLVHEMAHAAADPGHAKKWQNRMEKAAQKADLIGMRKLASQIREEIDGYVHNSGPGPRSIHRAIYGDIEDAVMDQPNASFEDIVTWVRRQYGISERDFLGQFKRARRVYDQAKKEMEEYRKAKAFFTGGAFR